jgi:hypothetical protein
MMIGDLIPSNQQQKTIPLAWADDFSPNALTVDICGEDLSFQNNDGTEKTVSLVPGELSKLNAEVVFEEQRPKGFSEFQRLHWTCYWEKHWIIGSSPAK